MTRIKLPPSGRVPFEVRRNVFQSCRVRVVEFRAPRKGEHYLSGARVTAYLAPNDLTTPYWIAEADGTPNGPTLYGYA